MPRVRMGKTAEAESSFRTGKILDFPFKLCEIIPTGKDQEQGYLPLLFAQLPREGTIPFDVYLKVKHKDSLQPRFIPCCPRGQVFPEEWRRKLQQLRISSIYFAAADAPAAVGYLEGRLEETLESPHRHNLEKAILTYDVAQLWARNFFASPQGRADEQLALSLKFIDSFLHLVRQEKSYLGFVFEIRRHDLNLYTHCLNVCLLGLAFLSYLCWDEDKARAFGLGAMLHDIGLTETSPEVLKKKAPLTPEEREHIARHPTRGFQVLKSFGSIGYDSLTMVLQHHENGDGSGYPEKLRLASIHPWARILRILDTYEAMTADRPWRLARSPQETLWAMRNDWQKGRIYDPAYLKAFIKFLGNR